MINCSQFFNFPITIHQLSSKIVVSVTGETICNECYHNFPKSNFTTEKCFLLFQLSWRLKKNEKSYLLGYLHIAHCSFSDRLSYDAGLKVISLSPWRNAVIHWTWTWNVWILKLKHFIFFSKSLSYGVFINIQKMNIFLLPSWFISSEYNFTKNTLFLDACLLREANINKCDLSFTGLFISKFSSTCIFTWKYEKHLKNFAFFKWKTFIGKKSSKTIFNKIMFNQNFFWTVCTKTKKKNKTKNKATFAYHAEEWQ